MLGLVRLGEPRCRGLCQDLRRSEFGHFDRAIATSYPRPGLGQIGDRHINWVLNRTDVCPAIGDRLGRWVKYPKCCRSTRGGRKFAGGTVLEPLSYHLADMRNVRLHGIKQILVIGEI
jgi:hypothetical protein